MDRLLASLTGAAGVDFQDVLSASVLPCCDPGSLPLPSGSQ
jgi:hypothetical protein